MTLVGLAPPSRKAVTEVARTLMVGVNAQSVQILPYRSHGNHACVAMVLIHSRGGSVSSTQLLAAGRSVQHGLLVVKVHSAEGRSRRHDFALAWFLWILLISMLALCVV